MAKKHLSMEAQGAGNAVAKRNKKYSNDFLGMDKRELKKVLDDVATQLGQLDPSDDKVLDQLVVANEMFDKVVEAYYAKDCGDHWLVVSARHTGDGRCKTYKVKKEA